MIHLTDSVLPITPEEAAAFTELLSPMAFLTFRMIGKRGVICSWPDAEPIQFITRRDPVHVKRLAAGWNDFSRCK